MAQNTVKDDIRAALENAGFRTNTHNVELVYQTYMSSKGNGNYAAVIREVKAMLKK